MHGCLAVLLLPPEFNPGIEGYRLVVPDDHFGERVALQEPLADVLELLAIKGLATYFTHKFIEPGDEITLTIDLDAGLVKADL